MYIGVKTGPAEVQDTLNWAKTNAPQEIGLSSGCASFVSQALRAGEVPGLGIYSSVVDLYDALIGLGFYMQPNGGDQIAGSVTFCWANGVSKRDPNNHVFLNVGADFTAGNNGNGSAQWSVDTPPEGYYTESTGSVTYDNEGTVYGCGGNCPSGSTYTVLA